MTLFVIEAYGGQAGTGAVAHFRVNANSYPEALRLVKESRLAHAYGWFMLVDRTGELDVDEPGIVDEGTGPYIGAL